MGGRDYKRVSARNTVDVLNGSAVCGWTVRLSAASRSLPAFLPRSPLPELSTKSSQGDLPARRRGDLIEKGVSAIVGGERAD